MHRDRMMRSRRRGLSPTKAVFVYVLAFFLVTFHQSGRLAEWFDDQALESQGLVSAAAFEASGFLKKYIVPRGPAQMNRAEDRLLAWLNPAGESEPDEGGPRLAENGDGGGPAPAEERPDQPGSLAQTDESRLEGLPPDYWEATSIAPRELPEAGPAAAPPAADLARLPDGLSPWARPGPDGPQTFNPAKVLLLGDSMMLEGLGPPLQRELKKNEGLTVNRDGRYGTGLARLDNFDWLAYFDQMMDKYEPDLVIMTLGANDPQDMVIPGQKRLNVGTEAWNEIYAARVDDLLARAAGRGVMIFWVGLPIMGREPYGQRVANINQVTAEVCGRADNCRFWDSWLSVADAKGQYATFLPDGKGKTLRVRAKDNIHLTESGGRLMAEKFLAETSAWVDYRQKAVEEEGSGAALGPAQVAPSAGDGDPPMPGRVTSHKFASPIRGKETVFFIASPDVSAARPGPFPVVFLLHGAWDGAETWIQNIGAETLGELAGRLGLILVMPDGEPFGWYLDGRETAIESYLIKELLPLIFTLKTADASRVGVTGLSMGGHGALTLALKHPDIFKAVGAMSGITDLAAHSGRGHKINPQLKIEAVLGPAGADGRNWRDFGARGLTEKNPGALAGKPVILSVGRGDSLTLAENRDYHLLLNRLNISHTYNETSGGHDWKYWGGELPVHLEFMAGHLSK